MLQGEKAEGQGQGWREAREGTEQQVVLMERAEIAVSFSLGGKCPGRRLAKHSQ